MDKRILFSLSYGLYIVSSVNNNGKPNGQVANTVFQITSDPVTVAISINKLNLTHEFILQSKLFSISILNENTSLKFIGKFGFKSGRDIDKFADTKYDLGVNDLPLITENSVGYIACNVEKTVNIGETHTLFIGNMVVGEILNNSRPMTYTYYHNKKNGKTPEKAPTFIKI